MLLKVIIYVYITHIISYKVSLSFSSFIFFLLNWMGAAHVVEQVQC